MKYQVSQSRIDRARARENLDLAKKNLESMALAAKMGDMTTVENYRKLCAHTITTASMFLSGIITIDDIADEVYQNALDHGWYDKPRNFGEVIALMHSELSEALEEYRQKKPLFYIEDGKPEGIATELIDCIIRILDTLRRKGVCVESILWKKHQYNKGRPYKHGGKRC